MSQLTSKDLTFSYANRLILDRISMELKAGEVVVLLGANGAGKTTLLQSLCRQLRPESGTVEVAERDIKLFTRRSLAQNIAFMPQHENRQSELTVHDVVSLGRTPHCGWWMPLSKHDREVVEESLKATGLSEYRQRLITQLSGGEWRRMILARALAQDAPILLLDEPTAGLDPLSSEILKEKILAEKKKNKLILITSHILSDLDELTTHIMYMQEGKMQFFKDIETLQEETGELRLGKAIARIMKGEQFSNEWIDKMLEIKNDEKIY